MVWGRNFTGYGRHAPQIDWPGQAQLAVNLVIVYEEGSEYSLIEGHGRNEGWGEYAFTVDPPVRDLGTETHFEYGSRVGIWRLARMLDELGVKATISACALALERNPEVPAWMIEAGHDLLGHGWRWFEAYAQSRTEEAEHLKLAIESYRRTLGWRPIGWNQRSFPSVNTFDLLVDEGGFLYTSDPCNDEIPYFVPDGRGGRMLVMPYSKTFNDSRFLIAPGYANPGDFAADVIAGMDYLRHEAEVIGPRMMTVAVHARWTGQPNRASGLRRILEHGLATPGVAFLRRDDMARHVLTRHGDLPTQAPQLA
jgi:peptidoglycan/xylan/chitin deacetylase (PgdA/CDA1 family)